MEFYFSEKETTTHPAEADLHEVRIHRMLFENSSLQDFNETRRFIIVRSFISCLIGSQFTVCISDKCVYPSCWQMFNMTRADHKSCQQSLINSQGIETLLRSIFDISFVYHRVVVVNRCTVTRCHWCKMYLDRFYLSLRTDVCTHTVTCAQHDYGGDVR